MKKIDLTGIINTEKIENFRLKNNFTKKGFCEMCKIGTNTYQRILTGQDFYVVAIFKIARVMKVHAYTLFNNIKTNKQN